MKTVHRKRYSKDFINQAVALVGLGRPVPGTGHRAKLGAVPAPGRAGRSRLAAPPAQGKRLAAF